MIRFLSLSIVMLLFACEGAPGTHHPPGNGSSSNGKDGSPSTSTENGTGGIGTDLELVAAEGSAMSLMDSVALTQIYSRVFSKGPLGYVHCDISTPVDVEACNDMFSPEERIAMGSFSVYNTPQGRGEQNINKTTMLTLSYMRSLRAGLARECNKVILEEKAKLAVGTGTQNLWLREGGPLASSIDTYYRQLMGVQNHPEIKLDFDGSLYAGDFQAALKLSEGKAKDQQNIAINLCIAVSMDPQIFLY